MRRTLSLAIVAVLTLVIAAPVASAGPPPAYFVDEETLPFAPLTGATAYWGTQGGAGYRIEVPDNWNGDLVMWAHGFAGTGLELKVDNHPLRVFLISQGYAWAASSYSRNDYDIAVGVQDTHALAQRFSGITKAGLPERTFITGASMGGHITAVSIEQYPMAYDAAMPICGAVGDHALFDYFLDFNLAAQQLGIGSSQFPVDTATYIGVTVPAIKANLEAFPGGWPIFLNSDGTNLKNLTELRSGGDRPNFDEAWFFWNSFPEFATGPGNFLFDLSLGDGSLARAPGSPSQNVGVVYQFDNDQSLTAAEQAFNDGIARIAADPQTRRKNGLAQVPTISGDISIPVLTLHNLGDLFVPVLNEVEYATRVAANDKSDLLVQRAIRGVLHCDFTPAELVTGFVDLMIWVNTGVKPEGDDWLDPTAVANPAFGCTFTIGDHLLATPCP